MYWPSSVSCGKKLLADWQGCRDVIDTDRGRRVKLDTARSSKEKSERGSKEEEKRANHYPVYFCMCTPMVLYLLLLQTGQRESAT